MVIIYFEQLRLLLELVIVIQMISSRIFRPCFVVISSRQFGSSSRWSKLVVVPRKAVKTTSRIIKAVYHNPAVIVHWKEDINASISHGIKWIKTGFKLFFRNLTISKRLLWKAAMGHQLSLRDSKLLLTTTTDLFKLVPFSLFIIIPFAELALPIFLRIFPNMLPSTFLEKSFDSAQVARRIRAKKELADFFQHVVDKRNEQELERLPCSGDKVEELREFKQLLSSEEAEGVYPFPSVTEIVRFAKLFESEFKLENMPIEHLQQICRMLGLVPFGFKQHVVLQLRHYVNRIQSEDRRIMWEGVEWLRVDELIEACHARGMPKASEDTMRKQLDHWLQLSSRKEDP